MMKKYFTFLFALLLSTTLLAQDTLIVSVKSKRMEREIANAVFLPLDYDNNNTYPTLYLLNGYSGNHLSWLKIKPTLQNEATKYGMIIICPDGQNSWYWDSPIDSKIQFETYISQELVNYVDTHYSTIKSTKGRAVTGLSMGGHGALWLGINHPTVFGACGSMSGGVDIRPFPNNWDMKDRLGKMKENYEKWNASTIINQLYKIEPGTLEIMIDCGYDDFFYEVNERLHEEMLYMKIKHDYITRPGAHDAAYWENAIDYQLLFFSQFFNKQE